MKPPAQKRNFAINATATLTLVAAAGTIQGCGNGGKSIVGTWGLDTLSYDGHVRDLPYSYSYGSYSYTVGFQLQIDSETSGSWCGYEYYNYDGTPYDYEYCDYSVSITEAGTATYDIKVNGFGLTMTCELDGDNLGCDGDVDGIHYDQIDWVRVD